MCNRVRRALVESYVGAIGLGWILAQGIFHLGGIFISPVALWIERRELPELTEHLHVPGGFPFQAAVPELARAAWLLLLCYILLRWLYFKPLAPAQSESPTPSITA